MVPNAPSPDGPTDMFAAAAGLATHRAPTS